MQIGQHVLCINDDFRNIKEATRIYGLKLPIRGIVYTIRDIIQIERDEPNVYLAEIVNPIIPMRYISTNTWTSMEPSFWSKRFRPLNKIKVEDFTTTEKEHELERV